MIWLSFVAITASPHFRGGCLKQGSTGPAAQKLIYQLAPPVTGGGTIFLMASVIREIIIDVDPGIAGDVGGHRKLARRA
jgi:hypothetical protein